MKKMFAIGALFFFFLIQSSPVFAGNLGISASTRTVTQGGTVTITVNASGLAGRFSVISSNKNVLSGGTSSEWIESGTRSYRFTAKSVGTATITVNPLDVASIPEGSKYTGSRSVTINVVKPREKSNNNYLSSLSIEGYSISPEFSKNQLEYSVEVPAETEKILINATKSDSYASLEGNGERDVSEGDNRFEIKVTSETGKERVYVLNVTVKDNNPIFVKIGQKDYTVVKKASSLIKPELFEEKKVSIGDIEVPGFYNEISNLTLVGLRDEDAKVSLYIYNQKENSYIKYQPLTSTSISIISLPNTEGFKKYSKVSVKLDGETYEGYQINAKSNYIYFYGLRIDSGKKNWYLYNKEENTLQLYQEEEAKRIEEQYEKKLRENKMVIVCLGGISILLALIILILVFTRKDSSKRRENREQSLVDLVQECNNNSDSFAPKDEDFLDLMVAKKVELPLEEHEKSDSKLVSKRKKKKK